MNGQRLLAALCFALLCSGLLTWQLSRHMTRPAPSVPMRDVVVAAKDLAVGEALTSASLNMVKLPASSTAVAGLLSSSEGLNGRVLLVPVSSGEPLTAHELASTAVPAGLAATIPTGMRVISVPVSDLATGNAGPNTPGNHVDVLVSYHSDAAAALVSSMVLENVLVVRDPRKAEETDKPAATDAVELLVTPEQAARLTVAGSLGKLTFALRNGVDSDMSKGLTEVALTSSPATQKAAPSQGRLHHLVAPVRNKETFTVEMISGEKSSTQMFTGSQP